jgi:hypothetical protein
MDGAIRFTGPDAHSFLQGQLTNDLRLLAPDKPLLAACCAPQGRVIAVLELVEDAGGITALLPSSMVERTIERLRKYVLRAKVTMADASGEAALQPKLRPETNESRLQDIAAGRPQVFPETSEAFVAQMLNLDLIGAISFDKGCYTGQEIVARAHYRGQVKRRMQRFRTLEPRDLTPGDEGHLTDGRSFKVVQAAHLPDGRSEFLAITPLSAGELAADAHAGAGDSSSEAIAAESLPLPYALPR